MKWFHYILLFLVLLPSLQIEASNQIILRVEPPALTDSIADTTALQAKKHLRQLLNQKKDSIIDQEDGPYQPPVDTTSTNRTWYINALRNRTFSLRDTTIRYPQFLDFCITAYRWFDRTFNLYDTAYVRDPITHWRVILKNNNWVDFYHGSHGIQSSYYSLRNDLTCNFGGYVSYYGIGLGLMVNVRDPLGGRGLKNMRWNVDLNTMRVILHFWYKRNTNNTLHVIRMGDWKGSYEFEGLKHKTYGVDAKYIFNYKHYYHQAVYGYGKFQRRSSGSLIAGIRFSRQDVDIDLTSLPDEITANMPTDERIFMMHFIDYSFLVGYGFNWVISPRWTLNATLLPAIGYRRNINDESQGRKHALSTSLNGQVGFVLHRKRFFYGLNAAFDIFWSNFSTNGFINSTVDLNINIGLSF